MNPFLKTLLSQLAGVLGGGLLYAFDHPTGGFASTLTSNPTFGIVYVSASQLVHNLISKYLPPAAPAPVPTHT